MTREEFIQLSKSAFAPALKRRKLPNGDFKIFYSKGGPFCIVTEKEFSFNPCDTCEAKRQERLAGLFFDKVTTTQKRG